jgi:hexosaminidase
LNLLPYPRSLHRKNGHFVLPETASLFLEGELDRDTITLPLAHRLQEICGPLGCYLEIIVGTEAKKKANIRADQSRKVGDNPEAYTLRISALGIQIQYASPAGLRAAVATLRQLLREYGRRLPLLTIHDFPDFAARGVMLDISRGRVPNLATLLELVEHLADFKINEFQLYTEHTFAYRDYREVWEGWGPLTGEEILKLDQRSHQLGIELVPNQNSFGHLRYWLEYPPLKKLAEIKEPYVGSTGTFLRYPATLAPNNPGTLPFLGKLYDELLPCFTSGKFNVGCDETWDLGRGQSKALCERLGKGRVYVDFLKQIHREVKKRQRKMMFWGDIILHYPELIKELPKDVIALNWGYEADHPFEKETATFARSGMPFYVCPGTATWMTLIGRHDTAFQNLRKGALAGKKNGARGYLNTDWGDGGHPQPLAVSYLPYLFGASVSWCEKSFDEKMLAPVLSRDVFRDPTQKLARSLLDLGFAHKKFNYYSPNITPFGAVIAAPPPKLRELFCREGLKYYARIPKSRIESALKEVLRLKKEILLARPTTNSGKTLKEESLFAAEMSAQSCQFMLWQQALAAGKNLEAKARARKNIRELLQLDEAFRRYWPTRNKGTTEKCSMFLRWRINDYRRQKLAFAPAEARTPETKTYVAE